MKVEKIYFKSGNIEYIDISITNVKNTSAGSTFNVEIHTNGIDLSEDIVFYFNYLLNGVVAKQSQEYTIESDRYIKCNQDDKIITLNDTDPLSVKIDGFKANFAFNNIQGSAYPIVTATCKPLYGSYADANVTIGDIDMHEDYTTFSLFIVFAPTAAT
ncbi:MAG: hypothetical protein MJ200_01310 [Mycoplasmoidaceae bacterium]|nr:hypothetical protein [Mycoplasmoidaceae bacterium]